MPSKKNSSSQRSCVGEAMAGSQVVDWDSLPRTILFVKGPELERENFFFSKQNFRFKCRLEECSGTYLRGEFCFVFAAPWPVGASITETELSYPDGGSE